jgi:hypothetical protein
MKPRSLAALTLLVSALTVVWLILLLSAELSAPSINTLDGQVTVIENRPTLFAVTYVNAVLLTLACVAMLAGYTAYFFEDSQLWSAVAAMFVPIYGLINIVVYMSQVLVVPQLVALYRTSPTAMIGETWLRLALHTWPSSATGFANVLAYAILAIPSIIFGLLLTRRSWASAVPRRPLACRLGGLLLAISGLLSILALAGIITGETILSLMSPASGFVFLLGLLFISAHFLSLPSAISNSSTPALSN